MASLEIVATRPVAAMRAVQEVLDEHLDAVVAAGRLDELVLVVRCGQLAERERSRCDEPRKRRTTTWRRRLPAAGSFISCSRGRPWGVSLRRVLVYLGSLASPGNTIYRLWTGHQAGTAFAGMSDSLQSVR